MATFDELLTLKWPEELIVEDCDGTRERLLPGKGILITPPADDPEGVGGICADLPKKHPRNRSYGRCVRVDQLRAIYTTDAHRLWPNAEPVAAPDPAA